MCVQEHEIHQTVISCQCTDCGVLIITQLIRNVSIVVAVAVFMVDDQ